jgi:aminoglycoside/choline kinase family phosphotransferase
MEGFYFRAVEDLVTMQTGGGGRQRAACHAYAYSFDEERFLWELNFTMEHWLNGLMGIALPAEDADDVQELFRDMARAMLDQDLCFTHRDYHSRNLMVLGEQLRVLDFQDARLGPPQYDLASLLRDSYVTLPPGWEELLLDYYFRIMEWEGKTPGDIEEFMRVYEIACLQRNLKAIGTFASQKTLRGNDHYLEYIPPTLSRIKENRAAREKFYPLIEILASHVPGW